MDVHHEDGKLILQTEVWMLGMAIVLAATMITTLLRVLYQKKVGAWNDSWLRRIWNRKEKPLVKCQSQKRD